MVFMSGRFYLFLWAFILLSFSLFFMFIFFMHLLFYSKIFLSFDIYSFSTGVFLTVSIMSDALSSSFSCVICFISFVVFMFTHVYFSSHKTYSYFLWITFLFVCSMLILVNFSDFFFVLLGWDGLGLISYFLITYYQSPDSLWSSLVTVLLNRLGDVFFMLSVSMWFSTLMTGSMGVFIDYFSTSLGLIMIVTFMTKSALFPFSPWLPEAMAAPTPISALVHSSTLVAAGLFLVMRNYDLLACNYDLLIMLTVVGVFTSFYAGLASLAQPDLKKVVALSTLSHLGFIATSLGLGWLTLASFHLMTHALFKSSLFIGLGLCISQHHHYQDSRLLSSLYKLNPLSASVMFVSCLNLVGFPFMSGFYSKDFILEAMSYSASGFLLNFIVYLNVLFTVGYSFRIIYSLIVSNLGLSFTLIPANSLFAFLYTFFISSLSFLSILFGGLFGMMFNQFTYIMPLLIKFMPVIILLSSFLLYTIQMFFSWPSTPYTMFYVPFNLAVSMFYLWSIWLEEKLLRSYSVSLWESVNESYEYGALYSIIVKTLIDLRTVISRSILLMFYLNWQQVITVSFIVFYMYIIASIV